MTTTSQTKEDDLLVNKCLLINKCLLVHNCLLVGSADRPGGLINVNQPGGVVLERLAILDRAHYARLVKIAFPWWAFWRRSLRREYVA